MSDAERVRTGNIYHERPVQRATFASPATAADLWGWNGTGEWFLIIRDAGLVAYRDINDALALTATADAMRTDWRSIR